jgi:hypothetical protein
VTWGQLAKGQAIKAYVNGGWKKGNVISIHDNSCIVSWGVGGNNKLTRIYDLRHIKSQ